MIFWSRRCLCGSRLQNSEFCSISKSTIAQDLKQELTPGRLWPLYTLQGQRPGSHPFTFAFYVTKIIRHLRLGWVMWEQIGESGSKMCKFTPSGRTKGKKKNNKLVHSTWVGKATAVRKKSAIFSCQTWPLDALVSECKVQAKKTVPTSRGPGDLKCSCGILCWCSQTVLTETPGFSINLWVIYIGLGDAHDQAYKVKESRVSLRSWGALINVTQWQQFGYPAFNEH